MQACEQGQEATTVLNAANEIAVDSFLKGRIRFTDIANVNYRCLDSVQQTRLDSIEDILQLDEQARATALSVISTLN